MISAPTIDVVLRARDVKPLAALEAASQPLPWNEDELLLELCHSEAHVMAVQEGESLVAYCALRRIVDECWVFNIATHPVARRKGYARRLLERARRRALADRASALWLEVRESNVGARALYRQLGFCEVAQRPLYYTPIPPATERETAVVMSLALRGAT